MRFRYKLNELRYAVQNKYNRPASRRIALGEKEENAIELYVKNLRENIGRLVIPSNPHILLKAQRKVSDMELWIHDANRSKMERINKPRHSTFSTQASNDSG